MWYDLCYGISVSDTVLTALSVNDPVPHCLHPQHIGELYDTVSRNSIGSSESAEADAVTEGR